MSREEFLKQAYELLKENDFEETTKKPPFWTEDMTKIWSKTVKSQQMFIINGQQMANEHSHNIDIQFVGSGCVYDTETGTTDPFEMIRFNINDQELPWHSTRYDIAEFKNMIINILNR